MGLPSKVVGVYWTRWNQGIRLTSVPAEYNLQYLFAATRGNSGAGSLDWGQNEMAADARACRARGQRIILSTGGAGQGISFTDRSVSTRFVDSVVRINQELGGTLSAPAIDGVDFNTFEAEALPNTPEYLWTFAELKRRFGQDFGITSPPAPWKQQDKDMIRQALAQGLMDYAAPQYYDGPGLAEPSYIVGNVAQWVRDVAGGDASKIVVGFGMESTANYSTIDQITSAYRQIKQAHPNIRGAFLWQHKTDSDRGWSFAKQMGPLVGAGSQTPIVPPPPVTPNPDQPDTRPKITVGTASYPLSGVDVNREADALVVYTSKQATTQTNVYGAEATVVNGKVTAVVDRQTTNGGGVAIPAGGFVLSGHGAARMFVLEHVKVGATVQGYGGAPAAAGLGLPALARGATDKEAVRTLQALLVARGVPNVRVDGIFGTGTEAALKTFQTAAKVTATGKTDDATWRKLLRLP